MLYTVTAQTIIDEIRERAEAETSRPTSSWLTDTHCLSYLNAGLVRLDIIERSAGSAPVRQTQTITATGASSYSLDADAGSVVAVYRVESTSRLPLDLLGPDVEPSEDSGQGACYRLTREQSDNDAALEGYLIEFYPLPSSGTYEIHYEAGPTRLTAVTDYISLHSVAIEWLGVYGAYRALRKEESHDTADRLKRDMDELTALVELSFRLDNKANPRRIRQRVRGLKDPADIFEMYPRHRGRY